VRQSLSREVEAFDIQLAKLNSREGQMEAKVEDAKHRLRKVESEIKMKHEFRETATTNAVQLAVSQEQLQNQLEGLQENTVLVAADVEAARVRLEKAEHALRSFQDQKTDNNMASLNEKKQTLERQKLELHKEVVSMIQSHERMMKEAESAEAEFRGTSTEFYERLSLLRKLNEEEKNIKPIIVKHVLHPSIPSDISFSSTSNAIPRTVPTKEPKIPYAAKHNPIFFLFSTVFAVSVSHQNKKRRGIKSSNTMEAIIIPPETM